MGEIAQKNKVSMRHVLYQYMFQVFFIVLVSGLDVCNLV